MRQRRPGDREPDKFGNILKQKNYKLKLQAMYKILNAFPGDRPAGSKVLYPRQSQKAQKSGPAVGQTAAAFCKTL